MSEASPDVLRDALVAALRVAHDAGTARVEPLERAARGYARGQRLAGVAVEKVIIEVKEIVRDETRGDDMLFTPRVIGWCVAGYFAGMSPAGQ